MNKAEILRKAQSDEGMTVAEIKAYQMMVEQKPQVYGKWGTLKLQYLKEKGIDWTIANLPEYLHGADRQAEDMYNVLYAKLSQNPLYKRTGEFMEDYRRLTAMQHAIEEEILHELIYTEEATSSFSTVFALKCFAAAMTALSSNPKVSIHFL